MDSFIVGDCLEAMRAMPDDSVDLVLGSPPYEDARTYGIKFNLRGQDWVDWMVERMIEMRRVCKGLVAMVVEGKTRKFRWSATPVLLMADLHRAGFHLRKPPAFCRVGIPGSGGPDWWRNDYEFIVCTTKGGKLPWSDNTACGHPPKWAPGGAMSNRTEDGSRKNRRDKPETRERRLNQWGHSIASGATVVDPKTGVVRSRGTRPSHRLERGSEKGSPASQPVLANPGNLLKCIVGGGVMGHPLAHENEAPYPESLAEKFIRSFCPEGGIVLDPFGGSGTTAAVATKWGRRFISIDIRAEQVAIQRKRIEEVRRPLLSTAD